MTFFIRNDRNDTIAECEVWNDSEDAYTFTEISTSVDITTYSELLLTGADSDTMIDIIKIFSYIQELRGWLWEDFYTDSKNEGEDLEEIRDEIRALFLDVAEKFDLQYVED